MAATTRQAARMPGFWVRRTLILLLSPVGLLLISVTRLLIISDYNTTTATTIASSGGYVSTLLGTVIPLVPIFLPYLAVLLLAFRRFVLSGLTFGAAILVTPTRLGGPEAVNALEADWHHLVALYHSNFLATIVILLALLLIDLSAFRLTFGRLGFTTIVLALTASAFLLPYVLYVYPYPHTSSYYELFMRQPWLPAERIITTPGHSVVGYVLTEDSNWMVVLQDSTRTIKYIPAGDVTSRTVCQANPENKKIPVAPLLPLLHTRPATLRSCAAGGSQDESGLQTLEWASTDVTTSSSSFSLVHGFREFNVCASGPVLISLSVELHGAPAGFRVVIDQRQLMEPGPVRFVPLGRHDTFSFVFVENLRPINGIDLHSFEVEWRSPYGTATNMERGTVAVQYESSSQNC